MAYRAKTGAYRDPNAAFNFNALAHELTATLAEAPSLTAQSRRRALPLPSPARPYGSPLPVPTAAHLKARGSKFRSPAAAAAGGGAFAAGAVPLPTDTSRLELLTNTAAIFARLADEDDDEVNRTVVDTTTSVAADSKSPAPARGVPLPTVTTVASKRVSAPPAGANEFDDADAEEEQDPTTAGFAAAIASVTSGGAAVDDATADSDGFDAAQRAHTGDEHDSGSDSDVYGSTTRVGPRMRWGDDDGVGVSVGGVSVSRDGVLDLSGASGRLAPRGTTGVAISTYHAHARPASLSPAGRVAKPRGATHGSSRRSLSAQPGANGSPAPAPATTADAAARAVASASSSSSAAGAAGDVKGLLAPASSSSASTSSSSGGAAPPQGTAAQLAEQLRAAALKERTATEMERLRWVVEREKARREALQHADTADLLTTTGGVEDDATTGSDAWISGAHPTLNPTQLAELERQAKEELDKRLDAKLGKIDASLKSIDEKAKEALNERQRKAANELRAMRDALVTQQKTHELQLAIELSRQQLERAQKAEAEALRLTQLSLAKEAKEKELQAQLAAAQKERERLEAERKAMEEAKLKAEADRDAAEQARQKAEADAAERAKQPAARVPSPAVVSASAPQVGGTTVVAPAGAGPAVTALAGKTIPHNGVLEAAHRMDAFDKLQALHDVFDAKKNESLPWRMVVGNAIKQISGTQQAVADKSQKLIKYLKDAQATSTEKYAFTLVKIAEIIVEQGEGRVATHAPSAFGFAFVAAIVCVQVPDFAPVLLAKFHKKCIYTIPQYLAVEDYKGRPDEYRRALGYSTVAGGAFEDEQRYFERMRGYITLYAAFLQVQVPNHPFGIGAAWTWLARLANMPPKSATAAVLHGFLTTAGYQMMLSYSHQFPKVLNVLLSDGFFGKIDDKAGARHASRVVLAQYLTAYNQTRSIDPPEGHTLPVSVDGSQGVEVVGAEDHRSE